MIPVARVKKPAGYDKVQRQAEAWRKANQRAKRPKAFWSPYLPHLDDGFAHLCGYAAMLDPTGGTVDHFLSWKNHPHLAYEWTNFRFVSALLNSSKRDADDALLDPYRVERGWFEILLPSLQLRLTDEVPAKQRAKAEHTLQRLKLGNGEKMVRWRQRYYEQYQAGRLDLEGLRLIAPLIAEAVEREQRAAGSKLAPRAAKASPKTKPRAVGRPARPRATGQKRPLRS